MIVSKEDLRYYLEQDRLSLHMWKEKPGRHDVPWKYEIILRKAAYYSNKKIRPCRTGSCADIMPCCTAGFLPDI